jgi:hypothetical protein
VDHGDAGGADFLPPSIFAAWKMMSVGLPLAGGAAGVDEGDVLLVDSAALAVGVGFVLVGVENLELVAAVDVDAAVAAVLAFAGGDGLHELDVDLGGAEGFLRDDIAGLGDTGHGTAGLLSHFQPAGLPSRVAQLSRMVPSK